MQAQMTDILALLIKHELATKKLYETFAGTFTKQQHFWQKIASDEQDHADRLKALGYESITQQWMHETNIKPQAIQLSIGYIENQISKVGAGHITLVQALAVARDLESALVERFSRLKDSAPKEIRESITSLAEESEIHRKMVSEFLAMQKNIP